MHVTRQRRVTEVRLGLFGRRSTRRVRVLAAGTAVFALVGGGLAYGTTVGFGDHQVGNEYADGLQISSDQVLKPLGQRLMTPYGKFMGSSVSPDGRFLAATSADRSVALQIFDLSSYKLIWTVGSASFVNQKLSDGSVGQEKPTYSPDGKFLWISQSNNLTRFPVNSDGSLGVPTTIALPKINNQSPIPGEAIYSPDGSTLYVAVNGNNTVMAL